MSLVVAILALGLLASLSPSTLVVFILLLATARARVNAAAFLVGWTVSLTLVFIVSYMVGGGAEPRTGSGRTAVDLVEILLGAGLVLMGVRQWRVRHEPREPTGVSTKLADRIQRLNPATAAMVGVLEQPWTITAAAAVVVVHHHSAFLIAVIAFLVFTVASTATVAAVYLYFARRPGEAAAHLEILRARLVQAGPTLIAVVALAVGVYLMVDGALGLTGH
jgi:hypothetical protein